MTTIVDLLPASVNPIVVIEPFVFAQLEHHRQDYSDIFLAGGYLRDRVLGLKPKDIDLFTFKPLLEGRHPIREHDDLTSAGGGTSRVAAVEEPVDSWDVEMLVAPYPVQIVHLNPDWAPDFRTAVEQFAFGIMQVVYDAERRSVDWTLGFKRDADRRTFTVYRCEGSEYAHSIYKKYLYLLTKFEGWPLIVPRKWVKMFSEFANPGTDFQVVEELT